MSFLVLFGFVVTSFGFAMVRTRLKASKLSRLSWEDLVARLKPVPVDGISIIAVDYLQPTKGQIDIETNDLWAMVGGLEGLKSMYANAEVLIALAGYAQQWNPEESVIVGERMRRDGLALRRATKKLSLGFVVGFGVHGPFHVQEAASAYYLMRRRLLALYETSHVERYSRLAAAL
jgi:hypothetical protein